MNTNLPTSLLCGLFLSVTALPTWSTTPLVFGEEPAQAAAIKVDVAGGRTFAGQLDARTDLAQLWLRTQRDSIVLLRPIRWEQVVRVRVADEDLSGEEFLKIVQAARPSAPERSETAATERRIVLKDSASSRRFVSVTRPTPPQQLETPRVRSLAIEAMVANWDADVEVDGLLVYVYPLDATGTAVPVRGTLQFDLTGQREERYGRRRRFGTLGRWSRRVRAEDFGPRGAVYKLPFQGVHPEFDLSVAPHGALHARLSVPSQGTFETTASMVRIRPYSSVRDELQLSTGRRFFPEERTGRGGR